MKVAATIEALGPLLALAAGLVAIFTPLLTVYVTIAARKVAAAAGVQLDAKQIDQLAKLAPLAVAGVEEYLRNAAKNGLKLTSNEKLEQAVIIMRDMALDGLKSFSDAQLKAAAEAQLPVLRAKLSASPPPPIDHDSTTIFRP